MPLGDSSRVVVGEPVAAIGSPFGQTTSLTVGVVSATERSIDSLTSTTASSTRSRPTRRSTAGTPAGRSSTPRASDRDQRADPERVRNRRGRRLRRAHQLGEALDGAADRRPARCATPGSASRRRPSPRDRRAARATEPRAAPRSRASSRKPRRRGRASRRRRRSRSSRASGSGLAATSSWPSTASRRHGRGRRAGGHQHLCPVRRDHLYGLAGGERRAAGHARRAAGRSRRAPAASPVQSLAGAGAHRGRDPARRQPRAPARLRGRQLPARLRRPAVQHRPAAAADARDDGRPRRRPGRLRRPAVRDPPARRVLVPRRLRRLPRLPRASPAGVRRAARTRPGRSTSTSTTARRTT